MRGNIATIGIVIIFILASAYALYLVDVNYFDNSLSEAGAVGDVQSSLLDAYTRAEQKQFYLDSAAGMAIKESISLLYGDQASFFHPGEGEGSSLECGRYAYQIWNGHDGCVSRDRVFSTLQQQILEHFSVHTLQYPSGGLAANYKVLLVFGDGRISAQFAAPFVEEPVIVGVQELEEVATVREYTAPMPETGLLWPSEGKVVSSCFGYRPIANAQSNNHKGIDITLGEESRSKIRGVPVRAVLDGTLITDPSTTDFGTIRLDHGELQSVYLHLDKSTIPSHLKPGTKVSKGDYLGDAKNTGCPNCGWHLHFELLRKNPPTDASPKYARFGSLTALDPFCFFAEEQLQGVQIVGGESSCRLRDNINPPYCDTYGIEDIAPVVTESAAPTENAEVAAVRAAMTLWEEHINVAAEKYGIDKALILAVITQESTGNRYAISSTECCAGLMQISNITAPDLNTFEGMPIYSCKNCKSGNCLCRNMNDPRFDPELNIMGGTEYLRWLFDRFKGYSDQARLSVAAYNLGIGHMQKIINALQVPDPSWEQVAAYMESNNYPSGPKAKEVIDYVPKVMGYHAAFSGGEPIVLAPPAPGVRKTTIGMYRFDPSVEVSVPDLVAPFVDHVGDAERVVQACADADVPGNCITAAFPMQCEHDPGVQFFVDLYQSLKDCGVNMQEECSCRLPIIPDVEQDYEFIYDEETEAGRVFVEGEQVSYLYLDNLGNLSVLRGFSDQGYETGPLEYGSSSYKFTLLRSGKLYLNHDNAPRDWLLDEFFVEKNIDGLLLTSSSSLPVCAPVKTHYALCAEVADETVRFAVEVQDPHSPMASATMENGMLVPSGPSDVSFFRIYQDDPAVGPARTIMDTQEPITAFEHVGETLYVAAVDQAGNIGEAFPIEVTFSDEGVEFLGTFVGTLERCLAAAPGCSCSVAAPGSYPNSYTLELDESANEGRIMVNDTPVSVFSFDGDLSVEQGFTDNMGYQTSPLSYDSEKFNFVVEDGFLNMEESRTPDVRDLSSWSFERSETGLVLKDSSSLPVCGP